MRGPALAAGLLVASTLSPGMVRAEMEDRDYQTTSPALDAEEADKVRRRIAEEVAAEARVAAERARIEAEAAHAAEAVRAARPRGVRLLEERCTSCHGLDRIEATAYGRLGWHLTVLRMRWVNGARLDGEEARVVAEHLHDERRASLEWQILELVALLATAAAPVAMLRLFLVRRRRRAEEAGRSIATRGPQM